MFDSLEVKVLFTAGGRRSDSEAQGLSREAKSERSAEQTREPMNKNWIGGLRCRASEQRIAKPKPIKLRAQTRFRTETLSASSASQGAALHRCAPQLGA